MSTGSPRDDALAIWHAGLAAVRSDALVQAAVRVDGDQLHIRELAIPLADVDRIVVVGGGKAGGGMSAGLEAALGKSVMSQHELAGWVNVPEGCERPLSRIHLHPARPAGVNEPREEGVAGTQKILQMVETAGPRDLCICLLSGGGSALLPAPVEGVSLADKQRITARLSAAGANIEQLNTVRKHLSRIKGGGLARACQAGRLVTLIISDVLGDPLDVIASGPTVPDTTTTADALAVLNDLGVHRDEALAVFDVLEADASQPEPAAACDVHNFVIGNNATAVEAAAAEAARRGYQVAATSAPASEGTAEEVARMLLWESPFKSPQFAGMSTCHVSGGEPVVQLADEAIRGKGGRNQQLALAALVSLLEANAGNTSLDADTWCLLSAGTDGEDGPTDAAGALIDREVLRRTTNLNLDPADHLHRNNAYPFFAQTSGLIQTGPTDTNVCDLRVVVSQHK